MFDINFLEKPGILQDKKSMPEVRVTNSQRLSTSIDLSIDSELNKTRRRNTKNYLLILISIGLLLLIMGSILNHNKINQADVLESVEIPVENFFNVLQSNNSNTKIYYIYFTNQRFSFKVEVLDENIFYNFLDALNNDFNEGLKAIHKRGQFSVVGEFPWIIENNNDFTINLLDKEISDFALEIRKEIYKDKLIIICELQNVFNLLNLIVNLNLINRFQIQVEEIQTLPGKIDLFQIIIH